MKRSRTGWRSRKRFLEAYVKANGYVCEGHGRPPHPAYPLEVDHLVSLALGGTDRDGPRVLCRHCNRSAGARLGNALNGRARRNSRVSNYRVVPSERHAADS